MALVGLVRRIVTAGRQDSSRRSIFIGLAGVALFYGDGMITPAISVLSAVEGVKVAAPSLSDIVLPIALAVLTGLFAIQRFGTHVVGRLFGPVMIIWFLALAGAGGSRLVHHPQIIRALSPTYAVDFFSQHPSIAFISLGSVVLTVTGAEALYADMGHFGRRPISRAWFLIVFPALMINYMGQGSLILDAPDRDLEPVLPADARVGAGADDLPRHDRDADRLAGGDLRCVLGDTPGDPARLPAAPDDPPHLRGGDRPGLRAGGQLGAVRRGRRAGHRLRVVGEARHRVRDRGDRHPARRLGAVPVRGAAAVAQAAVDGLRRRSSAS